MAEYTDLISVIVPVYGTEEYLPACIDSICNQSYPYLQIILVDDQSPDKCPEICDLYAQKDSRIIVIHQENKGVCGARNAGMRCVAGKYVMFVDSDDELCPDAIEILLREAKEYDADIASGDFENNILKESADSVCESAPIICRNHEALLLSLSGKMNTESACAKLFKFDFIKDILFEEGKNIHEDGFFIFQCCTKNPIFSYKNVAIYKYNAREGSSSRQIFSDKYLSMLYFCERKKEIINADYPQYVEQMYSMEVRTNLQVLDVLCSTRNRDYLELQKKCIKVVKKLNKYHVPANAHHKQLAHMVVCGLYPIYKIAVRLKYYRQYQ